MAEGKSVGNVARLRSHYGIVFINLGSLLVQIVQIAGYPALLALFLARGDYPSWMIGIIISLQWVVVLALAPFVPAVMKSLGVRSTVQAGPFVSIVALTLLLLWQSTFAAAVSSLLMGVGLTLRWVACDTWIVETVQEKMRGRAIGIHETVIGLGAAIGPLLIILSDGNKAAALIVFIFILLLSFISYAFGSHISATKTSEGSSDRKGYILTVFQILVLALLATLVCGYIETSMVAMLPLYLMNFHHTEAQALLALSMFGLGGAVLQAPIGWIADRWGFRVGQLLCLSLIIIGGILLMTAISLPLVVAVILFIWGGCVGGLNTLAVIEVGSTLRTGMARMGMALVASSYTLGGVVGPVVTGSTLYLVYGHGAILAIVGLMIAYAVVLGLAGGRTSR